MTDLEGYFHALTMPFNRKCFPVIFSSVCDKGRRRARTSQQWQPRGGATGQSSHSSITHAAPGKFARSHLLAGTFPLDRHALELALRVLSGAGSLAIGLLFFFSGC